MRKSRLVLAALTAGALALAAHPLLAATTVTSNFTVQATVNDKCIIKTGPATYDFGVYDPTSTSNNDNGSGSAVIKCTKGTTATIALSNPNMTFGANSLSYNWFSDSSRATAFGTVTYNSTSNADHTVDFYGRIDAGQDVAAGSYSATATLSVTY